MRCDLWFHVCSLGEARAIAPLLEAFEGVRVGITTITQTGFEQARRYDAQVRYLPFELFLPFWVRTPPKVLVVLEAELWYLLFAVARARGSKIVLLNARMSERSFPKYLKLAWFYRRIFDRCEAIYVQSEADKNRFVALGALHVEVLGNIKLAQKIEATKHYDKPPQTLIVAASTHEGEEEMILEAFVRYRRDHDATLLVVPRHPERFERVWARIGLTCNAESLGCLRWSEGGRFNTDVLLVDTMGELNNLYAISDIAVLGGAFRDDVGGHNPLEPARFGCKIITGTHFFHQQELFRYVHHVQYVAPEGIEHALREAASLPPSCVDEPIDCTPMQERLKEMLRQSA